MKGEWGQGIRKGGKRYHTEFSKNLTLKRSSVPYGETEHAVTRVSCSLKSNLKVKSSTATLLMSTVNKMRGLDEGSAGRVLATQA